MLRRVVVALTLLATPAFGQARPSGVVRKAAVLGAADMRVVPITTSRRVPAAMARIPAGRYLPLYDGGAGQVEVRAFAIDRLPVTRGEYLEFVRASPAWRRGTIRPLHAGRAYLASWAGDLDAGTESDLRRPTTEVSWFAAKAYCAWRGKRLPTVDEWEYVAAASETRRDAARDGAFIQRLVALYTAPLDRRARTVGSSAQNAYGVADLHGLVWEWVLDYNAVLVSDDSRGVEARDHDLYCASAAIGATDRANFPAFLRYAYRAGLTGRTTSSALGFRCAQSL